MYVSHHVYDLLTAHMAAQLLFYSDSKERKAFYLNEKESHPHKADDSSFLVILFRLQDDFPFW